MAFPFKLNLFLTIGFTGTFPMIELNYKIY